MLSFAAAVFLLFITPGPGVLSLAGVGSGYGWQGGLRYGTGLFIGTNLVMTLVLTGLAAIVLSVPAVRLVLMGLSVCYLLYLAARIALAGSRIAFAEAKAAPGLRAGVLLQLINPKAYAVNTAMLTGFSYAPHNLAFETVTKVLTINFASHSQLSLTPY